MFIETVKSEGLAHLSYLIGDGGKAAAIDPRRDCDIYVDLARRHDCAVTAIFETHRNEDLVSGAPLLASTTHASIYHGPTSGRRVDYAETVAEDAVFHLGHLGIRVLETPGHTDDSLSLVIHDANVGDDPVGVFTGDALFIGDVGRTDFYPTRAREVAGLLFDSLRKLEALGDQTIVYPAHGAGSICGDNMADREFSTIGHERRNNPMMRIGDRDEFIARKLSEHHYQPPYFRLMETLNSVGCDVDVGLLSPGPLVADAFSASGSSTSGEKPLIVDTRDVNAFCGGHLPDSLCIPLEMIASYAGWLLDPERELRLVVGASSLADTAVRHLARIGYDRARSYLIDNVPAWAAGGKAFGSVPVVDLTQVAQRVAENAEDWVLLDVRGKPELMKAGVITGSRHVYLGELPQALDTLPRDARFTVMCSSGVRAAMGASLLLRHGIRDVDVFLGSMGAWQAAGYPTERAAAQVRESRFA